MDELKEQLTQDIKGPTYDGNLKIWTGWNNGKHLTRITCNKLQTLEPVTRWKSSTRSGLDDCKPDIIRNS